MLPRTARGLGLLALVHGLAVAFPGFPSLVHSIRQEASGIGGQTYDQSTRLIGDLERDGPTSPTGELIRQVLQGETLALVSASEAYTPPPGDHNAPACRNDVCCVWSHLVPEMVRVFTDAGDGGRCSDLARSAIRLGFHDAAA